MAIYPDKNAKGEITGRFRVELQRKGKRYRERHDTLDAAKADEARVLQAWATGEEPKEAVLRKDTHIAKQTLRGAYKAAQGSLWVSNASARNMWVRLDRMVSILGEQKDLDSIVTTDIDAMILVLVEGGNGWDPVSDATVNRYLSIFHKFLTWAKGRSLRTVPVSEIVFEYRSEDEGRIRWVTPEEEVQLERLLPEKCWKLVKVAIETGCRKAELLTAEPAQVNGNKLHLWKTKTSTPRTVPMEPSTTRLLLDVLRDGMPTVSEIRYQWDKAKKAMGLMDDEDFVFHALRHTCATRLVEANVNLRVIQKFMGHKVISTTERYAHVRDLMLEDALELRAQHVENNRTRSLFASRTLGDVGNQDLQAA